MKVLKRFIVEIKFASWLLFAAGLAWFFWGYARWAVMSDKKWCPCPENVAGLSMSAKDIAFAVFLTIVLTAIACGVLAGLFSVYISAKKKDREARQRATEEAAKKMTGY